LPNIRALLQALALAAAGIQALEPGALLVPAFGERCRLVRPGDLGAVDGVNTVADVVVRVDGTVVG